MRHLLATLALFATLTGGISQAQACGTATTPGVRAIALDNSAMEFLWQHARTSTPRCWGAQSTFHRWHSLASAGSVIAEFQRRGLICWVSATQRNNGFRLVAVGEPDSFLAEVLTAMNGPITDPVTGIVRQWKYEAHGTRLCPTRR